METKRTIMIKNIITLIYLFNAGNMMEYLFVLTYPKKLSEFKSTQSQIKCNKLMISRSLLDVLGDGFGSFRNGVSGEFSWKDELHSRLDFSGRKSSSLVESDKFGSFGGNSVESIMNERVHDVHGFLGDTDVGVDLLEDLVDVDGECFNSSSSCFLLSFCSCFSFCHWFFLFKWSYDQLREILYINQLLSRIIQIKF